MSKQLLKVTPELVAAYMGNKPSHDMWLTNDEVRALIGHFNVTRSPRRATPFDPKKKNPKYLYTISRKGDTNIKQL